MPDLPLITSYNYNKGGTNKHVKLYCMQLVTTTSGKRAPSSLVLVKVFVLILIKMVC